MKKYNSEKRKSGYKKIFVVMSTLLLFIIAAASYCLYDLYRFSGEPGGSDNIGKMIVVKQGQGFNSITSSLYQEGIISSSARFKIIGALTGKDKKIKAGEYLFSPAMSPEKILSALVTGKVHLYKLTIPEGYNLHQIADAVEKAGFFSRESFVAVATDATLVKSLGINPPAQTFEGYLFPDTYYFPKGCKPVSIIKAMVNHFRSVYKSEWIKRASEFGFTMHEVLTLASIIEKETGDASERPIISSVFHNRLKKNMRLETDPTVIYGIQDFDGNLTKKHLRTKTPYNTYKIKGLPPGPIANPGVKAIEAALFPVESDYLYFVSKRDNTHQFSTNFRDHINSVRKYQLRRH